MNSNFMQIACSCKQPKVAHTYATLTISDDPDFKKVYKAGSYCEQCGGVLPYSLEEVDGNSNDLLNT